MPVSWMSFSSSSLSATGRAVGVACSLFTTGAAALPNASTCSRLSVCKKPWMAGGALPSSLSFRMIESRAALSFSASSSATRAASSTALPAWVLAKTKASRTSLSVRAAGTAAIKSAACSCSLASSSRPNMFSRSILVPFSLASLAGCCVVLSRESWFATSGICSRVAGRLVKATLTRREIRRARTISPWYIASTSSPASTSNAGE